MLYAMNIVIPKNIKSMKNSQLTCLKHKRDYTRLTDHRKIKDNNSSAKPDSILRHFTANIKRPDLQENVSIP